jgi:hypothetical protein
MGKDSAPMGVTPYSTAATRALGVRWAGLTLPWPQGGREGEVEECAIQ